MVFPQTKLLYSLNQLLIYHAGATNVDADHASQNFTSVDTEWMLNLTCLAEALQTLKFQPSIDLLLHRD